MNTSSLTPAGFWRRFAASFIDYTILAFITYPLLEIFIHQSSIGYQYTYQAVKAGVVSYSIFLVFFTWCYFAGMESSPLRATTGKLVVGIYVVDDNGDRLSYGRATGRYFSKIISGIIVGIGYFMAGFTNQKKALHDMIAGTLVVAK